MAKKKTPKKPLSQKAIKDFLKAYTEWYNRNTTTGEGGTVTANSSNPNDPPPPPPGPGHQ